MEVTVADIKRAVITGGDVASYAKLWGKALGDPPVTIMPTLAKPAPLPGSSALLKQTDESLEGLVNSWLTGEMVEPPAKSEDKSEIELTLLGLPPYGRNSGSYLAHLIDEIKPEYIAIDTTPLELSANMLYTFSIPCAVGLAQWAQILRKDLSYHYADLKFYPGNLNEIALFKSWQNRVPLVPVGMPTRKQHAADMDFMTAFIDVNQADKELSQLSIANAYRELDSRLAAGARLTDVIGIIKEISQNFSLMVSTRTRGALVDEGLYIASRITELLSQLRRERRKGRLLALVDISRYHDVDYTLGLLLKGITDEIYVPTELDVRAEDMVLVGKDSAKLNEEAQGVLPATTVTQEVFAAEFEKMIEAKNREPLTVATAEKMLAEIAGRTREHEEIARGTSVRGTIAFREVLDGFAQMYGGINRESIARAATITLPPRLMAKQLGNEAVVVDEIAKEVLYDFRFIKLDDGEMPAGSLQWLTPDELMKALKNLKPVAGGDNREPGSRRQMAAVVADGEKNQELLKYLESKKLLKQGMDGQYSLTKRAVGQLLNELEAKFKSGEISEAEYVREKHRLTEMLKSASQPRVRMSAKELANTVMEIMDAQDKQWNSEVTFERLNVYYHIKANTEMGEAGSRKRDYYGLKTLIGDLERQGLINVVDGVTNEFTLTGDALDMLLDYLVARDPKGRGFKDTGEQGKTLVHERKNETRRYTSGDVFRDISVRHTLREIARKKKALSRVTKDDFKVFMKERRQLQSDIVLCMDVSGSMGFQHKLMYARLAAAGLAKAALENEDRVGLVAFNNTGQTTMPLTTKDKEGIINDVVKLSARGNTNIGDGIRCATELLFDDHSSNEKHIILITDGEPTAISQRNFSQLKDVKEKDLTEESAILETRKAVQRGVKVSVVHVATANEASGEFIKNIARIGRGMVRRIASPDDLRALMR
ncbi:MAG: VWA domain-containing protein [Chloroflexota bacterium]